MADTFRSQFVCPSCNSAADCVAGNATTKCPDCGAEWLTPTQTSWGRPGTSAGDGLSFLMTPNPSSAPHDDTPTMPVAGRPSEIGRYKVRRLLGRGGFGAVYLAWDPQLDRLVALKVTRGLEAMTPSELDRFRLEARTTARLNHPSIIHAYDVGALGESSIYIVLEYIDGVTLRERLAEGGLSPTAAATWAIQIARALQHAHKQRIFHRDLKPGNVMIDAEGRIKVGDFGIALHDSDRMRANGEIAGTPAYMSPEQTVGDSRITDGRADLWSLGVILYEMLTGSAPFAARTTEEVIQNILHLEPTPPTQLEPSIPVELERICLKLLRKNPAERYSSAAEVIQALSEFLKLSSARKRSRGLIVALAVAGLAIAAAALRYSPVRFDQSYESVHNQTGVWMSLLNQDPKPLLGSGEGPFVRVDRDARNQELSVESRDQLVLKLGDFDYERMELQCGIYQNGWSGGCGVFWGYSETALTDRRTLVKFQTIETAEIDNEFYLIWSFVGLLRENDRTAKKTRSEGVSAPTPLHGQHEHTLELIVNRGGLHAVRWAGQSVPEFNVRTPQAASRLALYEVGDCNGPYGLTVQAASGRFRNVRAMHFGSRSNFDVHE